ncbi:MAG TPA: AI-2E family transporter [Bacteroidales bacterium]|mgnify:CR=1 FL=1|jgi:predicted PurR-regulated permease PerM|nr:AI-2E family transporter [Bacteroidales bacterium]MDI9574371.1 AI-2E family transporter [Bacteroidota bacterium]OQC61690.1 MAG: hypothetical protein BWX51_00318 [Bacteroidetes bacterium ADurb.Bin012]MBP9511329.1 AI-2E family transporter [Bacteroidales bacterium]MBP9587851.1 AI-2E family transporter [Bacteroidales bacterium]
MASHSRRWMLVLTLLIIVVLIYYFTFVFWYIGIAGVFTLLGRPIERKLRGAGFKRFRLPAWASSLITLLILILVVVILLYGFVAIVYQQALVITKIDFNTLAVNLAPLLEDIENFLHQYHLLPSGENLEQAIVQRLGDIFEFSSIYKLLGSLTGFVSSFAVGAFAVAFLTFFFLRDDKLLMQLFLLFVPYEYETRAISVLNTSRDLLGRYVGGLFLEVFIMMVLLSVGMMIAGIPNALLIGFIGGFFNLIPYLGPFIGGALGVLLTLFWVLAEGSYATFWVQPLIVVGVFIAVNMVDNFVLQPQIYSKRVNAHPIEIFLIMMMGGSVGGIIGMILAVPAYTLIRIVGKEFLSSFDLMDKLTRNL